MPMRKSRLAFLACVLASGCADLIGADFSAKRLAEDERETAGGAGEGGGSQATGVGGASGASVATGGGSASTGGTAGGGAGVALTGTFAGAVLYGEAGGVRLRGQLAWPLQLRGQNDGIELKGTIR